MNGREERSKKETGNGPFITLNSTSTSTSTKQINKHYPPTKLVSFHNSKVKKKILDLPHFTNLTHQIKPNHKEFQKHSFTAIYLHLFSLPS